MQFNFSWLRKWLHSSQIIMTYIQNMKSNFSTIHESEEPYPTCQVKIHTSGIAALYFSFFRLKLIYNKELPVRKEKKWLCNIMENLRRALLILFLMSFLSQFLSLFCSHTLLWCDCRELTFVSNCPNVRHTFSALSAFPYLVMLSKKSERKRRYWHYINVFLIPDTLLPNSPENICVWFLNTRQSFWSTRLCILLYLVVMTVWGTEV